MTRKPGENLLWRVGCNQDVSRTSERDPLSHVGPKGVRLSAGSRSLAVVSLALPRAVCPGGYEPEAHEDPPRLVGCEVGAIEARRARKHLLRRKAAASDHDVVLLHWVGQETSNAPLDLDVLELERPPGDGEGGHDPKFYSLSCTYTTAFTASSLLVNT